MEGTFLGTHGLFLALHLGTTPDGAGEVRGNQTQVDHVKVSCLTCYTMIFLALYLYIKYSPDIFE